MAWLEPPASELSLAVVLQASAWWRRRLCGRGRSCLRGIGLIVQLDNLSGDVDVGGSIDYRCVLGGILEDGDESVFARIALNDVHHFPADPVDHFALRRVHVFLQRGVLAVELCGEPLPLGGYPRFLVVAPGGGVGSELLAQIVDLLVERLQFILLRGKLRLQFRGRLLPFRGRHDGLPDIDRADFRATRRARRCLPVDGCGAE